ncbi:GNAT family N-acetyltransferase [Mesoplasma chauliocola]|uniref:GNAT family N-acetyltransferase n=1 Tax=Mesoplasma chauliocola TaxID=216427 RepID=A0A249SP68_9MOLU|nr:GNAT family N-acetyltransferase [Mesoplasma chauliocola]ASZ09412.1 GNAT family N-acetyltransferase [Mesoplasma chauliocola]
MEIKIIKPSLKNKNAILKALKNFMQYPEEIEDKIQGSSDILSFQTVEEWIDFVKEGVGFPGWMPFKQYIAINNQNEVIGFINLRLELNENLLNFGGHIGYGVAPRYRNMGLATEMLAQTLKIAKKEGIKEILITCLDTNPASEKVILKNGGVYENSIENENKIFKRFWIK